MDGGKSQGLVDGGDQVEEGQVFPKLSPDHVDLLAKNEQPRAAPWYHCMSATITVLKHVSSCQANRQHTLFASMRLCKAACCCCIDKVVGRHVTC